MSRIFRAAAILAITTLLLIPASAYSYDRYAAANYAYNNAYNDVPGTSFFESHGGDCTNFVSHALQAGGWKETGKYWYASVYAWYYDFAPWGYSYTWGAANNLYAFMYYNQRATYEQYSNNLQIGDIVQIDYQQDGNWDHSMMVTGIDNRGLLVSYHSPSRRNEPLADIEARNPSARFAGWHIKDTYSS